MTPATDRTHRTADVIAVPSAAAAEPAALLAGLADALAAGGGAAVLWWPDAWVPEAATNDLTRSRPGGTAVATAPDGPSPVRVDLGRVVAAVHAGEPADMDATGTVGVLRVCESDRGPAAEALRGAADLAAGSGITTATDADTRSWVLAALVAAGIRIGAEPIAPWPWRTTAPRPEVDPVQARRIELTRANRGNDGYYSELVLRRLSKPITDLATRRGWSPNSLTIASLIIGLGAAALLATGSRGALIAGAVLLQVALVVDCCDGEVARLTGRYSVTGQWLDAVTDRIKEFTVYAALAAAAVVMGMDLWWAAGATLALQTARHLTDYLFPAYQVRGQIGLLQRPLTTADLAPTAPAAASAPQPGRTPLGAGLRNAAHLPIGERWLIISLTAAFLTPAWTFGVLLVGGLLSLAYATLGRVRRALRWPHVSRDWLAGTAVDHAPIGFVLPLGRSAVWTGRLGWLLQGVVVAVELGAWLVACLVLSPVTSTWTYALLFAIAFHVYDGLYRALAGSHPAWLARAGLGVDGRLVVLLVLVLLGPGAFAAVVPVLAILLAVLDVVASAQWLTANRQRP